LTSQILKASVPVTPYRVSVIQTIDQSPTNTPPSASSLVAQTTQKSKTIPARAEYVLHHTTDKGTQTETVSQSNIAKPGNGGLPPAEARLSINIPNFLKKIQTWPTNSIVNDVLDGKTCLKVSAFTSQANVVFWADATNHCILRVEAYIRGNPFAESTFKYQRSEGSTWLLSHVETSYAGDGNHVLLDYGAYDFSTK